MSSAHYIIVARHDKTGELRLPLGDLTLYGCDPEAEEQLLLRICGEFDQDWTVSIYAPKEFYGGTKTR